MRRALNLARQGEGYVEPNPMVGCVIIQEDSIVGEGWHRAFGKCHAEVEAIANAGSSARGGTLIVTLEPCCHHGKTPPCTAAILAAEIQRVVVAVADPFPKVSGGGIKLLRDAGIEVQVGLEEDAAQQLVAPYRKLVTQAKPWIIAKWAMTLDGKVATRSGDSKWITNPSSRAIAHQLRGRVDAIVVGSRTARVDDPLLTARPAGPRTAVRIVLDSSGSSLLPSSQLVQTAAELPTLVVTHDEPPGAARNTLEAAGCEVLTISAGSRAEQLDLLLTELGQRRMTNILIEGGGDLLGAAFDARIIDEVHAFIAPKLLGGAAAKTPLAGHGRELVGDASLLESLECEEVDGDIYLHGRLKAE